MSGSNRSKYHDASTFERYQLISQKKGDDVIRFDVHNWGKEKHVDQQVNQASDVDSSLICSDIFERLFVYSSGRVGFCCADDNGFFELGSVIEDDPIDIYNCERFSEYRRYMQEGRIGELEHCKDCTIPQSRSRKTNPHKMKTG